MELRAGYPPRLVHTLMMFVIVGYALGSLVITAGSETPPKNNLIAVVNGAAATAVASLSYMGDAATAAVTNSATSATSTATSTDAAAPAGATTTSSSVTSAYFAQVFLYLTSMLHNFAAGVVDATTAKPSNTTITTNATSTNNVILGMQNTTNLTAIDQVLDHLILGPRGSKNYFSPRGGVIRISRDLMKNSAPNNNNTKMTTNNMPVNQTITVTFTGIRELNINSSQVTDAMNKTHSLMSLSDQMFQCISKKNETVEHSDVSADCLLCSASLTNASAARFSIKACVIKANGTVTQDDEQSLVTEGQLKLTAMINDWSWCGTDCRGGAGAYLEFDIAVAIPTGPGQNLMVKPDTSTKQTSTKYRQPKKYTFGAGGAAEFSTKNGLNSMTLRFPRFNSSLIYDSTIEAGDMPTDSTLVRISNTASSFSTGNSLYLTTAVAVALIIS